jgi:hypothetical protein
MSAYGIFFLAPVDQYGLNAGATGLAIKFVLVNFVTVNVQLYFNARMLNVSFVKFVGHQVVSVVCLIFLALLAKLAIDAIGINCYNNIIIAFILSGMLYSFFVMLLVYAFPQVIGLHRKDINGLIKSGKKWVLK